MRRWTRFWVEASLKRESAGSDLMPKVGTVERMVFLFMEKGVANQTVIPAKHVPVKTGSGNPEAPQKLSASARRHVPTKDMT